MHESRCGVECEQCQRKEQVGCKGCLEMQLPFWGGECKVESCCEEKGLSHCGVCPDFPCDMASNMGQEQGFDPKPRLNRCRLWAGKTG